MGSGDFDLRFMALKDLGAVLARSASIDPATLEPVSFSLPLCTALYPPLPSSLTSLNISRHIAPFLSRYLFFSLLLPRITALM